jgi:hypothetical protein
VTSAPDNDINEIDPEVARRAAIEVYGLEVVEAAEAAFDEVRTARVLEDRATA